MTKVILAHYDAVAHKNESISLASMSKDIFNLLEPRWNLRVLYTSSNSRLFLAMFRIRFCREQVRPYCHPSNFLPHPYSDISCIFNTNSFTTLLLGNLLLVPSSPIALEHFYWQVPQSCDSCLAFLPETLTIILF
jgi:hypothetical protein